MKAYGHSRRDKLSCRYGCCQGKSALDRKCRHKVDRANRKSARQSGKSAIQSILQYDNAEAFDNANSD